MLRLVRQDGAVYSVVSGRHVQDERSELTECMSGCQEWQPRTSRGTIAHMAKIAVQRKGEVDEVWHALRANPKEGSLHPPRLYMFDSSAWFYVAKLKKTVTEVKNNHLGRVAVVTPEQNTLLAIDKYGVLHQPDRRALENMEATTLEFTDDGRFIIDDTTESGRLVTARWAGAVIVPHQQASAVQPNSPGLRSVTG